MKQFSRVVARNSALGMAAQLIIKVLSFCFTVLIVRNLGAESYGQYAGILAFGAVFVFIADLGLSPYAVREVARWRDKPDGAEQIRKLYGNILVLRLLLSVIAGLLTLSVAWLSGRPMVVIIALVINTLTLLIYAVHGSSDAILIGFERIDISSAARIANQITFVALGAAALFLGFGYYGLIIVNLIAVGVMAYSCWQGVRKLGVTTGSVTREIWLPLLKASAPFGIITFTQGLSYKFDSVLLSIFQGDAQTGYYNAAYNLVFSAVIISNVINTALYPSLSRASVQTSQRLPEIYERAMRYLLLLSFPIAVGSWALADSIVAFLFRKEAYGPTVQVLQIIMWVVPFMFMSEFLSYVVIVAGKEKKVARAIFISTGINVILNLILIPNFGLIAAAIMTVVTEAVLVSQYFWLLRSLLRQFNWLQTVLAPAVASLGMGVVLYLTHNLPLIVNMVLGGVVYTGLLLALRVVGKDEIRFIRSLRRRPAVEVEAGVSN